MLGLFGTKLMSEISLGCYKNVNAMLSKETVTRLRKEFKNNPFELAERIKDTANNDGILAEVLTFKNGHVIVDAPLEVSGHKVAFHSVVLMGEWIIDLLYRDDLPSTKEYIIELQKSNPKLRLDSVMTTGWYTDDGWLHFPTLQELIDYKF